MPIAVGDLVQNQTTVSVIPTTTLAEALNIMIEHNFSQLPVLDNRKKPIGMVTSTSIARALLRFGAKVEDLSVSDATVRVPDYPADEDLLYILDNILQHSVVFIVDDSKALVGILTEYDTTQYFRQRAEDIVLVEDIESALKEHLLHAYESTEVETPILREAINSLGNSWDSVRKKTDACLKAYAKAKEIPIVKAEIETHINKYFPKPSENKAFDALTLSEFVQLAQKNWQNLESTFIISSSIWSKMIDEVREIRNKLVHFRGDISAVERHSLRFCADWFKSHPINQPEEIITEEPIVESENSKEENDSTAIETKDTSAVPNAEAIERVIKIKYADFVNYLWELESKSGNNINIQLRIIEELVKGQLPQAARQQATWWTDISAHAQQWLETGWQATRPQLGLANPYITFNKWPFTAHFIKESWQYVYWCHKLECTERELKDAIREVGPDSDSVEIYIKEERQKRTN